MRQSEPARKNDWRELDEMESSEARFGRRNWSGRSGIRVDAGLSRLSERNGSLVRSLIS